MDSRLRIGNAIGKSEEEIAPKLMEQVKMHAPDEGPPALSSDGKGAYPDAMLKTWGKVPEYSGRGAPPKLLKPQKDWQCLQVIKKRKGGKLESVRIKVVYGNPKQVKEKLGCHTAYIERTNLTSRTMNGRPLIPTNGVRVGTARKGSRSVRMVRVAMYQPGRTSPNGDWQVPGESLV
jgi:hypothetical protein